MPFINLVQFVTGVSTLDFALTFRHANAMPDIFQHKVEEDTHGYGGQSQSQERPGRKAGVTLISDFIVHARDPYCAIAPMSIPALTYDLIGI